MTRREAVSRWRRSVIFSTWAQEDRKRSENGPPGAGLDGLGVVTGVDASRISIRSYISINYANYMAEGVGFEPTVRFHAHTLSKRAP
jgi:hypothetical protein